MKKFVTFGVVAAIAIAVVGCQSFTTKKPEPVKAPEKVEAAKPAEVKAAPVKTEVKPAVKKVDAAKAQEVKKTQKVKPVVVKKAEKQPSSTVKPVVVPVTKVTKPQVKTRVFYVTRHGQVGDKKYWNSKTNEPKLTPLGEEQAKLLGKYMKKIGFNGQVFASPLYRTMQTGTFAANEFGSKVIPEAGMQEYAPPSKKDKDEAIKFAIVEWGLTPAMMGQEFPDATVGTSFVYPWRVKNESDEKRDERLANLIKDKLATTKGDVLFVGHGASVGSFIKAMKARGAKVKGGVYNCCLFAFTIDENGKVVDAKYLTREYMPEEKITSNFKTFKHKK